jgi:hypothetical protein
MTTGYSAGAQPSASYLAIGAETTWGTAATDLTRLRFTTESLAGTKTRDRPNEVDGQRSVSMLVTTGEGAGGTINFAKSFKTYDDLIAAVLGGTWTADAVTDGDVFTSFTIEKKLLASVFFQYLGMYPSAMTLNIATGAFVGGSFTFVGKGEQKATTSLDATLGAAPTGRVINSSTGVPSLLLGGSPIGKVNSMTFNLQNQGAGDQRAVGDIAAAGINPGLLMATADAELYFKDFSHYDRFRAESTDPLAVRIQDADGKGYTFTLLAPLVDAPAPGIQAKDRPVMQRIQFMANPDATTGKTIEITRDAAA